MVTPIEQLRDSLVLGLREVIHSIVVAGLGPATHGPRDGPCRYPIRCATLQGLLCL